MYQDSQISTAREFAEFADNSFTLWQQILGKEVTHLNYGKGRIVSVRGAGVELLISFEGQPKLKLEKARFIQECNELLPPISLNFLCQKRDEEVRKQEEARQLRELEQKRRQEEKERQQREALRLKEQKEQQKLREAIDREDFSRLKIKYLAQNYRASSPVDFLYPLLIKIDNKECLTENEISWLRERHLFATLALYHQGIYELTDDLWELVKASGFWRDGGYPYKALEATKLLNTTDLKLNSAILTTRGGAFRDTGDLISAEELAEEAIKLTPKNPYPYNLMGALCYQTGRPEIGDTYFAKAILLGAREVNQDALRRESLEKADKEGQEKVAKYLLGLDPNRYKWAEFYLQNNEGVR